MNDHEKAQAIASSDHAFRTVMSTVEGRAVMWRLYELTDNQALCHNANHSIAQRNIALRDFGRSEITSRAMRLCIDHYVQMLRENAEYLVQER